MLLTPRYDGPPILIIEGEPGDVLAPVVRQRLRLQAALAALGDDDWQAPSRCDGWNVQDVVAHLIGVNSFWQGSVLAGIAGAPTRILAAFDPVATPPMMVGGMRSLSPAEVLEQFVASNEGYLDAVTDLDDEGWGAIAESPAGHVSVRMVGAHALWDSWVHERDILLPLGADPAIEADEVAVCLRYAAALGPAFAISQGAGTRGAFAVDAGDPDVAFVLEIEDSVLVRDLPGLDGAPCLQGPSVELVEALSMRVPLPAAAPPEWRVLLGGLATVFDAEVDAG